MPVTGFATYDDSGASVTSIDVYLPDMPVQWIYWGESPDYAGGCLVCFLTTVEPTPPSGWLDVSDQFPFYDGFKPARAGDIPPRPDMLIKFYTLDYGGGAPSVDPETFTFGSDADVSFIAMGTPSATDDVEILDPTTGTVTPYPGPGTDASYVYVVPTGTIPEPINGYDLAEFDVPMRGTLAVAFWVTGTTSNTEGAHTFSLVENQGGEGDTGDYFINLLVSVDEGTNEPYDPFTTLVVDVFGTDDPDSYTQMWIFEWGAATGRKWHVGKVGWG